MDHLLLLLKNFPIPAFHTVGLVRMVFHLVVKALTPLLHQIRCSKSVNPVRNSSGALNPAGIILKCNPAVEQRGIISNGVNPPDREWIYFNESP